MIHRKTYFSLLHCFVFFVTLHVTYGQCPQLPSSAITGNNATLCEGSSVTLSVTGLNLPIGSTVDWYIGPNSTFDPYNGEGNIIGSIPVLPDPMMPGGVLIADYVWTIPSDFCETQGDGVYWITAIPNPPPTSPCIEVTTSFFGLDISCPELILSGGGEVCEGNCPEDPTEINFTIIGDDTPYEADIVVTVSIFPPVQIDDLEITNGQSITVCLEGLFPSFDPATGILSVPVLAIGLTATVQVVSLVSAAGCPVEVDPDFITLTFIAAPTSNVGNDQTICAGETVPVSGSIGGSATESLWTTDGDGSFADPSDLSTTYTPGPSDIGAGEVILTLMGMDPNGSCIPSESSLTVFIDPSLSIEVNTPLTICDNDVASIFAMVTGSTEPCNWETSGDGDFDDPFAESTIYTPGPADLASGMVVLSYVPVDPDACLLFSEPLILTIVEAPEADIPSDLEICQGDSVVITIEIAGDYVSVAWDESGDGVLVINSELEVTYTPGPMDINDQFFIISVTILSSNPECGQITYNIPVNIILCDCPELESNPPSAVLCAVNDMVDLSSLLVAGGAGSWSITNEPPGSNPAILTGSVFVTNNSDPGPYTVTYTLNSPEPGCPSTTSETIEVNGLIQPDAGPDMAFCGPQVVLIDGQITPFSPTVPILWETLGDGTFGNNTDLSTSYFPGSMDSISAGLYLVLHVMDPVCGDGSDTVTLFFNSPPSTSFVNDTIVTCNVTANGSVINFPALITAGDASGTWTNPSGVPVDFSNPSSVDFNGIAEGFYLFQYQTSSAMSPCAETIYDVIVAVEDCLCPLLIVQNLPGGICNSQASLPLDAFIMAGAPGSWQIINTPAGANPGTLAGSTFLINGCDPGIYNLRFTFDAAPLVGCPDSAEIEIFIQALPTISISGDTSTCGQTIVLLNTVLGGSAIGVQWTTSGLGSYDDPTSLNPVYTPSVFDVAAAQVNLIATAIDTFGFCSVPADTISLFLVTPPSTTFSALIDTLCNHPDSGSVINFTSFIVQGDGTGLWADFDGAGVNLSDPTQVDFDGVVPGNYRFVYTTQTALAPCTDSMYVFTVLVEDCACPPLILSNAGVMLCQDEVKDLNEEAISVAPGLWIVSDGPAGALFPQVSGAQLSTTGASAGNYTLTYILTDSVPGCPATSSIPLVVEEQPFVTITDIECVSGNTLYEVLVQTNATSLTSDFGDVTTAGTGMFRIASIPEGQDITLLISSASGICSIVLMIPAPDCNCTLFIEDIADTITFCPGDTFVLIPFITGAQGFALSTWITPGGTKMQPTLPLYEEGEYIWIVRDMAGCEERDTFNAEFIGPEGAILTSIPPSCPGNTDGLVIVDTIIEGTPPYLIQLDNGVIQPVNQLPFTITDVGLGSHVLFITDMIGCTIEVPVVVDNQDFGQVDLGPDETIQKGDSVLIQPLADDIVVSSVTWNPAFPAIGIQDFWFAPTVTTLLSVVVQDTAGCVYEDQLLITVLEKETFYIANIFSPNGDQINDAVEVNTNLPIDRLVSFEIFDRWGGLLYGQYSNPPFQWDGTAANELAPTGVYVYKLIWKDQAGNTKVKVGDVTLAR